MNYKSYTQPLECGVCSEKSRELDLLHFYCNMWRCSYTRIGFPF
jgi:hypothetical protein